MTAKLKQPKVPYPIGTPEELSRSPYWKMNAWHACCAPDTPRGIHGCPAWDTCELNAGLVMDYEIPQIKGEAGPQFLGIQRIRLTNATELPKIVNTQTPCYEVPKIKNDLELIEGACRIVALEGEVMDEPGSEPVMEGDPPVKVHRPCTLRRKVKKFPRPHENPALTASAFAAEQSGKASAVRRDRKLDTILGTVEQHAAAAPPIKSEGGKKAGDKGDPRG